MTGTDSPVSMLSLTIQDPVRRTRSQGIKQLSGTTITSPGTRCPLEIFLLLIYVIFVLLTSTSHSYDAIFLIVLILVIVSYRFSMTLETEITKIHIAYF